MCTRWERECGGVCREGEARVGCGREEREWGEEGETCGEKAGEDFGGGVQSGTQREGLTG